jgi:hypothetical protein
MQIKSHIALFMAIILLISNFGMTGYERYCGCTGKVFSSVIIENIGDCCQHNSEAASKSKVKSCCNKNSTAEKDSCKFEKSNCCDTKVKYTHLDEDAAPIQAEVNFSTYQAVIALPFPVYKKVGIAAKDLGNDFYLKLNFKLGEFPPPYSISGRQLLQEIQLMRC